MARRAARTDANQTEIVKALRSIGALVWVSSGVGGGFPDLVVGYRRTIFLLEIKDGNKAPSAQKLTPDEEMFHQLWQGYDVYVVRSPEEAINTVSNATTISSSTKKRRV